jgi:hypothetical protein
MILTFIIVATIAASIVSVALAFELRSSAPQLRGTWDSFSAATFWPFWVLHFASPSRFSELSHKGKILAFLSIALLAAGVAAMLFGVFRFAAGGGSL